MNRFMTARSTCLAIVVAASIIAIGGCRDKHSGGSVEQMPDSVSLDEDALVQLLDNAHTLYWGILDMKGSERRTVGTEHLVSIDRAKAASLKDLRAALSRLFTDAAVDSVLRDFGVREIGGKLWMVDAPGGDVSDYSDADVVRIENSGSGVTADIDVPLGDSGQIDEETVRVVRSGGVWKLATSPFGGDHDADMGNDAEDESDSL